MPLLGPTGGVEMSFHVMETGSSVLEENSHLDRTSLTLATNRLNTLLVGREDDFTKLDVQGFELEVLRGAERLLASAKAVLELRRRPVDKATNHADLFFVPKDSPLMADTRHFV